MINDTIYFLGIDNNRINKEYSLAKDTDDYYYSGEVFSVYNIPEGKLTEVSVEYPVAFAKTWDNNIFIYAYDGEGGYHFTEYNTSNDSLSKKMYHDLGRLTVFDIYNKNNDIILLSTNTSVVSLATASPGKDKITELMPNVGTSNIVCEGEYTYYANIRNLNKIERIRNSSFIRGEKVIKMLSAEYSPYTPFGCGYTFEREYPDTESFALTVLSQDDSYDLSLMSSRQMISENIRNKGSFYPLNKVDGVKEYLDACFPYIKEASMTKDGYIWMVPISIDIPSLLYNENLCKEKGIDLTVPVDFEKFIDFIYTLQEDSSLEEIYNISLYMLTENVFHQYLRSYKNFDNEKFNKIAPLMKDKVNYLDGEGILGNASSVWEMLSFGNSDDFLIDLEYYHEREARFATKNDIRVSALPYITKEKTSIATCLYLCVNPYSRNLEATLQYISSLCAYIQDHNKTMLFHDRNIYPKSQAFDDLYDIYSNGEIVFTYPDELFMKDYDKYLRNEIDLDTFVREANRKLNTFIHE